MIVKIALAALVVSATITSADAQMGLRKLDDPFERWYLTEKPVPEDFEEKPLSYHPNFGYKHADALFKAGQKERAVYWMYQSQLRYRIQLDCHDLGPWDKDYDIYVALNADIDSEQNQWLGGDVQLWLDTVYKVQQDYDVTKDMLFSDGQCSDSAKGVMEGMDGLLDYLAQNPDDIRATRSEADWENRTTGPVTDPRTQAAE